MANVGLFPGSITSRATFDSRRDLNTPVVQAGDLRLVADSTIAQNQLVVLREDGRVAPFNPLLTVSTENNNTVGTGSGVHAQITLPTSRNYWNNGGGVGLTHPGIVELGSGNIAVALVSDASTSLLVRLNAPTGGAIAESAPVTVSTPVSLLLRLDASRFALVFATGSNLTMVIYNNDLTIAVASQNVATNLWNTPITSWHAAVLPSGDIVFAWRASTSNDLAQRRYDTNGVARAAAETVAGGVSPAAISVHPLSNGQYILHWRQSSNGRYSRRASDGTATGSIVTVDGSGMSSAPQIAANQCVDLGGGRIAIRASNSSRAQANVYAANDTLVAALDPGSSVSSTQNVALCPTNSGFMVIYEENTGSTQGRIYCYSAEGIPMVSSQSVQIYTNSRTDYYGIGAVRVGNYVAVIASCFNSSSSLYSARVTIINPTTGLETGSALVIYSSGSTGGVFGIAATASGGVVTVVGRDTAGTSLLDHRRVLRSSVIGVARHGAGVGQAVTVGTIGTFDIAQDIPLGGSFDVRTNFVPGNRGTVSGRSAVLNGTI